MDIADLIGNAPELLGKLQAIGIDGDKLQAFTGAISSQLGGEDGFDFGTLLSGLTGNDFLGKLDVAGIASAADIGQAEAQQGVDLLAPAINAFTGGNTSASGLLGMAKSLFGR